MATNDDDLWMGRALQLARNGRMCCPPNPRVGAVIVHHGKIIGEGYHIHSGQGHAEVNAIASVENPELLKESILYVTLEPCSHYGKTPPCSKLIIEKGIPEVVVGTPDPFHEVAGKGISMLREAGIKVKIGVREEECKDLTRKFLTTVQFHRPFITLKWAQSADGFIAPDKSLFPNRNIFISIPQTQVRVHRLRAEHQAIMVGRNTAQIDNPTLTPRLWIGPMPLRVCVDTKGRLDANLNIFNNDAPTLIVGEVNPENRQKVAYYDFLHVDASQDILPKVLEELHKRKIQSLLVEGGKTLLQSFIDKDLWDDAHVEVGTLPLHGGCAAPQISEQYLRQTELLFGHKIKHYVRL